jgi:anti-sigma regulatory factor (Ser/Thr protein kinase)
MEALVSAALRQQCCPVAESSQVAAARRCAAELAATLGFDDTTSGTVALLVTEAATNILKHAGHGEMLLRPVRRHGIDGIEVVALDAGPGIADLGAALRDGASGVGTYGIGLGAMRRLAHEFDAYSAPGKATAVLMVLWRGSAAAPPDLVELGVVCLPMPGEHACGDAWALACAPDCAAVMVADGLGHGEHAATASDAAAAVLAQDPFLPPATVLADAHAALRPTRGAAVACALIDTHEERISFAGVGNVAAHVFNGAERKQLVSHNGIVGSTLRKVQEFSLPWQAGALLILHSDGLNTRWDSAAYPGLLNHHPALVAAVLYRDFSRQRDDVTVVVLRDRQE